MVVATCILLGLVGIVTVPSCRPPDDAPARGREPRGERGSVVSLSVRDQMAVQRSALIALFVDRERAQQLVFWGDTVNPSPTLSLLRESDASLIGQWPDTAALALPMPVHLESLATLEQYFRANPDGWEAWFRRFPGSSGVVVLTRAELLPDAPDGGERASLVVGRTCGEHCHSAWRVTLVHDSGTVWRIGTVAPLTLRRD